MLLMTRLVAALAVVMSGSGTTRDRDLAAGNRLVLVHAEIVDRPAPSLSGTGRHYVPVGECP